MAIITKEQVKRCIGLGTVNPKILNKFFYDIKLKSYDYDYLIQEELIDLTSVRNSFYEAFQRSDTILHGVVDNKLDRVCVVQIDKDIVHYAKRKEYKMNKRYNKPWSMDEIMTKRDIFKFGVLAFINGKLTNNFRIQCADDKTFLYFPRRDYALSIKPTDYIDTVFIPEAYIVTSRTLGPTDKPDSFSLSAYVFDKLNRDYVKECKGFMGYLTPNGDGHPIFMTGIEYDENKDKFIFPNNLPNQISNFTCTLVGMERLSEVIEVAPDLEYLEIKKQKMPIPKNNLLIMVRDTNGYSYHVNTGEIEIKEYYPNIYQIINPNKLYCKIIVLYADNPQNELFDYDDEIKYYLSKVNLLDRYKADNVPDGLREYKPVKWDYNLGNYKDSHGYNLPVINDWFPFLYKLNKISSIYKLWCEFFQTYLRRTYGFLEGWTLDISTIDLSSKYRTETSPELPLSTGLFKKFTTPQYLFVYRNFNGSDSTVPYSWFIDGKYAVPTYSVAVDNYQYVYFDASLINENSIMEVERYDSNIWSREIKIGDGPTEVKVNWLHEPVLALNLFLTDESGNYIGNNERYTVSVKDESLDKNTFFDLDLDKSIFIIESGMTLKFTPTRSGYANKTIYINTNNKPVVYNITTSSLSMFDTMNLNEKKYINRTKKNIISRLRVFTPDGRMLPKWSYKQYETTNIAESPNFTIMSGADQGTPFRIQYMGYEEEMIYRADEIPANGLLNLNGKINKPFSLAYHDIFLNGFKLNKNQIEIIAPFLIAIKNVNTRKDILIYERIKGEELFKFNMDEPSQYLPDIILDQDPEYYNKILQDLTDIVVDPTIPDIGDLVDATIGLIKDFICENFINCDLYYSPAIMDAYETLYPEGQNRILFNADERVEKSIPSSNWFYMNHDSNIIYQNK